MKLNWRKSYKGNMLPFVAFFFLAVMVIFYWLYAYLSAYTLAAEAEKALQAAVISTAQSDYAELYDALRVGYSRRGGSAAMSYDLDPQAVAASVNAAMGTELEAGENGTFCIRYDDEGEPVISISAMEGEVQNPGYAPYNGNTNGTYTLTGTATVEIPFHGIMAFADPIVIDISVAADWTPRF